MHRKLLVTVLFLSLHSKQVVAQEDKPNYPVTKKENIVDDYFGNKVPDPYRWLEYDTLAEVKDWVKQQNTLSERILLKLYNKYELEPYIKLNGYMNFPSINKSGKYYFDAYVNSDADRTSSLYIKKKPKSPGQKVADPRDYLQSGHDRVSIRGYAVSDDNKYIAFGLSHQGSDWREIRVRTLYPFGDMPDIIKWVKFSNIEWYKDGFFYQRYPIPSGNILTEKNVKPVIYYHKLGTEQEKDVKIYQTTGDEDTHMFFERVDSTYLIIYPEYHQSNITESVVLYINLKKSLSEIDTLISVKGDFSFNVIGRYNSKLLVATDLEAKHGRLLLFNTDEMNEASEFVPDYDFVLMNACLVGNRVICKYQRDLEYSLVQYDSTGKLIDKVNFPIGQSIGYIEKDWDDDAIRFVVNSYALPPAIYQYNVNSLELKLADQTQVRYNFGAIEMEKLHFTSKDGTIIPMMLLHKKGVRPEGKTPTVLYGYGGYGATIAPFFDEGFVTHILKGGIVAIPGIRGGGEYGAEWHNEGRLGKKQNVFDDFIAAAEYLFAEKYTDKQHLAIMGGSNGGLLVTAIANQRPDLCRVVIAQNGVYDMLRYHHYTIGGAWKDEYGVSDEPEQVKYLYRYSPVHNIKDTVYPAVLAITGDHYDRVVPMHTYKYISGLQAAHSNTSPALMYEETNAGHNTYSATTQAYIYSFIYANMGLRLKQTGDKELSD